MRNLCLVLIVGLLFVNVAGAQQTASAPPTMSEEDLTSLALFGRPLPGTPLTMFHVNSRTVGILFQPPLMYSMRALANQSTIFYVRGTTGEETNINPAFIIEVQDIGRVRGETTSLHNLEDGTYPAGTFIDGIVEFQTKFPLIYQFTIHNGLNSVRVQYSPAAVDALDR
jgi:hypothetical protein